MQALALGTARGLSWLVRLPDSASLRVSGRNSKQFIFKRLKSDLVTPLLVMPSLLT